MRNDQAQKCFNASTVQSCDEAHVLLECVPLARPYIKSSTRRSIKLYLATWLTEFRKVRWRNSTEGPFTSFFPRLPRPSSSSAHGVSHETASHVLRFTRPHYRNTIKPTYATERTILYKQPGCRRSEFRGRYFNWSRPVLYYTFDLRRERRVVHGGFAGYNTSFVKVDYACGSEIDTASKSGRLTFVASYRKNRHEFKKIFFSRQKNASF